MLALSISVFDTGIFVGTWGEISSITCVYEFDSREIGLDCNEDRRISAWDKGLILSCS